MTLDQITKTGIDPALLLLPAKMDSKEARCLLLAIALQESKIIHRRQLVGNPPRPIGPAKSFWQFEKGSEASRGGVWGVFLHKASSPFLKELCKARGVRFFPTDIWDAIENDDVLAAGLARLLIYTDPFALPKLGDVQGAWMLYKERCWRPGKPHIETWPGYYRQALEYVRGAA